MKDINFKRRRKLLILAIIIFGAIPIIFAGAFILRQVIDRGEQSEYEVEPENGQDDSGIFQYDPLNPPTQLDREELILTVINSGNLVGFIGQSWADSIMSAFSAELNKESELDSAPRPNTPTMAPEDMLEAIFVVESFRRVDNQPGNTFTFNLTVSDGRTYTIYTHADAPYSERFLAILIRRTDRANPTVPVFVYYVLQRDLPAVRTWAENFIPNSEIISEERVRK